MKIFSRRNGVAAIISLLALSAIVLGRNFYLQSAVQAQATQVRFTDITQQAGIKFRHNNGAFGALLMPESLGSGVAFIDFDGDGDQDLFFVNGRDWTASEIASFKKGASKKAIIERRLKIPVQPAYRRTTGALYQNNGNGTFSDATRGSGLDIEMLGMGACVGDYDNNGEPDIYVTGHGRNYLFRNNRGKFKEVAGAAGAQGSGWSSSAAWLDYDRDGNLDLFVCRYVKWTPALNRYNEFDRSYVTYSDPAPYKGDLNLLYRNLGNGKFKDASKLSGLNALTAEHRYANVMRRHNVQGAGGLREPRGYSLGVSICDVNNDLWPDILIANDTEPNYLYLNNHNGTFKEGAAKMGVAYNTAGETRAGMGIDSADYDQSGHESVLIGNFADQMLGLYRNSGEAGFADIAPDSEVGRASLKFLTFGCLFADVNNDGWPDIVASNGHIDPYIKRQRPEFSFEQRPLLFLNNSGNFQEIATDAGLNKPIVGRGLAAGDIDLDGDLDLVFTNNGGAPLLARNDTKTSNHALRIVLKGARANRAAIGARIEAKSAGHTTRAFVRSGSSYLSQNELPLTVGLGSATKAEELTIDWPSGETTQLRNVPGNQMIGIEEGKGIIKQQPLAR